MVLISDIKEEEADEIAEEIRKSLDKEHEWYADYKNEATHYIIFRDKVFKINRTRKEEYQEATDYGVSVGIPDYQVDFSEFAKE